jgi:flavin reductase (DIM6/NTAB) family NADH-FMN oxidoreductase RutF
MIFLSLCRSLALIPVTAARVDVIGIDDQGADAAWHSSSHKHPTPLSATSPQAAPIPREATSYHGEVTVDDELLNKVTWKIPNALALVGSRAGDERNAMTTSWVTQLSMDPVLIGVGVDNDAMTHRLIAAGGSFTVNLWDAQDTKVFVKFSKPATDDGAALNGRPVHAATTGAPVFDDALAWMDCALRHSIDLGTHTLFVGEVVDAGINDDGARAAAVSDTRMKYGGVKRH